MLKKLLSSDPILKNWQVIARVITGIIIARYGLEVFSHDKMKGNADWLTEIHFPAPVFMAYVGKATELLGGILLVFGLVTRFASIALVVTMTVVIFIMGKGNIWGDEQLPFLLLLFFVSFILGGAGKWSLDYLLFDKKSQTQKP
ncbi:DoxX family protein [Mucilaginibacter sp.]|uniref:DoxX family protein n=1 Tax=Mucilaginibacter sp. TaxID=1882438 RepID=UPI0025F027B3|nr:DoxX family protein [Mucilaginibacter sp.]